jgi:hypothetical protein
MGMLSTTFVYGEYRRSYNVYQEHLRCFDNYQETLRAQNKRIEILERENAELKAKYRPYINGNSSQTESQKMGPALTAGRSGVHPWDIRDGFGKNLLELTGP